MSKVKAVEHAVEDLSREELAAFRDWFIDFDNEAWDRQVAADVKAGKWDALADKALAAHRRGESREL